jgi:hypothetical protein
MRNLNDLTVAELKKVIEIRTEIERLTAELAAVGGDASVVSSPTRKRGMSAAGRARIGAAARARWAKKHSEEKTTAKKKRVVSPAVKTRLAALVKERWKKAKAAGKTRL